MRRVLAFALGAMLLAACASPARQPASVRQQVNTQIHMDGGVYTLELTRTIDAWETSLAVPVDRVWDAVPAVYESVGLSGGGLLRHGERAYGFRDRIPRRVADRRPSAYLSCGRGMAGPYADEYDVRLFVVTSVEPAESGTRVSTTVDASATPRGTSGAAVTCSTTGELERVIAEALARAVAPPGRPIG